MVQRLERKELKLANIEIKSYFTVVENNLKNGTYYPLGNASVGDRLVISTEVASSGRNSNGSYAKVFLVRNETTGESQHMYGSLKRALNKDKLKLKELI